MSNEATRMTGVFIINIYKNQFATSSKCRLSDPISRNLSSQFWVEIKI